MLSIKISHLHFTFVAYQCSEHTTWLWCLYSCSILKTWESVTANVKINALVTINSLWKQSGHLNIIIIIIMHFDCIVKQFIIGYLAVVYHCIANHFPAHNHRHHHRHHHVWCMSILPTNVEAPTWSSSRHSRIVTASVSVAVPAVATTIEAPTIAIQQTCGDFDALHQSILQSTHILDELITMSYQQSPSISTKQLTYCNSHTVSKVSLRVSVAWMCAWICMCVWQRTKESERERCTTMR